MTGPLKLPPGTGQSPANQLLRYSFRPLEFLESCARRYGETFTIRLSGLGTLVQLTRPTDIREVFRADAETLHAGEANALVSSVVGDTSVLVLDEQAHVRQRKIMLPPLKGERMRTFFDSMQREALEVAAQWTGARVVRADLAMQAVILRVRNVIPFVVRVVKRDFAVGGFSYPKDIVLCPSIHLLHMREDLYPEPASFRPQRFIERKFAAHEWNPFGGGNRACLGQAFALYEMKVVLATLFTLLRLERPAGADSRPVRRGVSIGPSDGTAVRVVERRLVKT